jgi:hypothetical protein
MIGKVSETGSQMLRSEVLPSMKKDYIASLALKDPLIIALGDIWLIKILTTKEKEILCCLSHAQNC